MSKLFKSRKFLLILVDAFAALIGLSVAFFVADAEWQKYILGIWAALQPVFVGAIVMIGVEDAAALKAGFHPNQQE
jgi:hypothetical protein